MKILKHQEQACAILQMKWMDGRMYNYIFNHTSTVNI